MPQILEGTFQIPPLEEMIQILQANYKYPFDEYKTKQGIICSNMDWSDRQVLDELVRQKFVTKMNLW